MFVRGMHSSAPTLQLRAMLTNHTHLPALCAVWMMLCLLHVAQIKDEIYSDIDDIASKIDWS